MIFTDFSPASTPSRPIEYYTKNIGDISFWLQIVGGILKIPESVVFYFYTKFLNIYLHRIGNRLDHMNQLESKRFTEVSDLNILNNYYSNTERSNSQGHNGTFQIGRKSDATSIDATFKVR